MLCRQGPHQVAQKSSRTTLPRRLLREMPRPPSSGSVKSAAAAPGGGTVAELLGGAGAGGEVFHAGNEVTVDELYLGPAGSLCGLDFVTSVTALAGTLLTDPAASYLTWSPSTQARRVIITLPSF